MIVFVPRETKVHEYRVGMVPGTAQELVHRGHEVLVEGGAGLGSGIADRAFESAGARLVSAQEGYGRGELVVKVKEPLAHEYGLLRSGQTLFCYLHLAASRTLTEALCASGVRALAFETLSVPPYGLPLLTPMSEVAGKMSVQQGARFLENSSGGRGVLLGGVPGVAPAHVTILGGGVVGTEAARVAAGMGATVHILDNNVARLRALREILPANVTPLFCDREQILEELRVADLLIGAILLRGARALHLVHRADLQLMKSHSVIVDVAIDQGGCVETSRPTTHEHPTYVEEGIIHYCVPNIPGVVGRTSTLALSNVTAPYVLLLADEGFSGACEVRPELKSALNIEAGEIMDEAVKAEFAS